MTLWVTLTAFGATSAEWTVTIYCNNNNSWFDTDFFEECFFKILQGHIQEERVGNEKADVIGIH